MYMNKGKSLSEIMENYDQFAANLQHLVRHKKEFKFVKELILHNERSMFKLDDDLSDFERTLFEPRLE